MRFLAGMIWTGCTALILSCAGCSRDIVYDYSTGCVQIGPRLVFWNMSPITPRPPS